MSLVRSSPPPTPPYVSPSRKTPSPDKVPERPPSPDTCPICLDVLDGSKDRSTSNNCIHSFCYICLLEWSKNKRECPLCKKPFHSIIHNIKSYKEYDVHKLPPLPRPEPAHSHRGWNNVSWEWMGQMRRMFIQNRQRQLDRIRSFRTSSSSSLPAQNVMRPATSDYRRFIYTYGLYCEGAYPPGGNQRYRRVTPQFYRQNPAIIHRLIPWLNRELVAVLPHRDNVQFVLDHIVSEIKRVDLRSEEFRRSVRPFTLARTDHFIHEFHQFAMSPLDMAGFDRYARYPRRVSNRRRMLSDTGPLAALGIPLAPGAFSSSDSDSDIEVSEPVTSHPSGSSTSSQTLSLFGEPSRYADYPTLSQLTNPMALNDRRQRSRPSRFDTSLASSTRVSRGRREDINRLQRSLLTIDGAGPRPGTIYPLSAEVLSLTVRPEQNQQNQLIGRVRSFLDQARAGESLDIPLFGELTGEIRPAESSSNSQSSSAFENPLEGTSQSSAAPSHDNWHPVQSGIQPSAAHDASPASSHSSDIIFVSEAKPYRERTPIHLTSESESEKEKEPTVSFKSMEKVRKRRLSASSTSSASPTRPVHLDTKRKCRPPSLSESSGDEKQKFGASPQKDDEGSSDSDCVVTFEAAKLTKPNHGKRAADSCCEHESKKSKKRKHEKKQKHKEKHRHKSSRQQSERVAEKSSNRENGDDIEDSRHRPSLSTDSNHHEVSLKNKTNHRTGASAERLTNSQSVDQEDSVPRPCKLDDDSDSESSPWFLDYTHDKDLNKKPASKDSDIRNSIRSFAKTKIADKYGKKSYKKHHRGHKSSST